MKSINGHILLTLLTLITICYSSCSSEGDCFTPPVEFRFDVRDEDGISILSRYEEQDIKLYYFDENQRATNVYFIKEGYLLSGELPIVSSGGIDTFYLDIDSTIDTLIVDVRRDQSDNDCSVFFYHYVAFNGEPAFPDTTIVPPIYIIRR